METYFSPLESALADLPMPPRQLYILEIGRASCRERVLRLV